MRGEWCISCDKSEEMRDKESSYAGVVGYLTVYGAEEVLGLPLRLA